MKNHHLAIPFLLALASLASLATAQLLPPLPTPPASPPLNIAATAFDDSGIESDKSNIVQVTNGYPFSVTFDPAPDQVVAGFRLHIWRFTNQVRSINIGTNTTFTVLAPTNKPAPPLRLVISNSASIFIVTNLAAPSKFFTVAVLESDGPILNRNLDGWRLLSPVKTEISKQ